ncbi:universal stress protein [Advenella sp. FME57]|uniref:universal stress protein n=1 Tax=Advenella sp. FME57 TaxID=2742604 RepID=UPI0018662493|nr:universal stress protein [Advenella sp. FME57]
MYTRILAAIDGSDINKAAFDYALRVAKDNDAILFALYIIEYPNFYVPDMNYDPAPIYDGLVAEGDDITRSADWRMNQLGICGHSSVVDNFYIEKSTAEQIQISADEFSADLVVLGTHGRGGFKRLLLGSVAESFVRISTRPVLLIPINAAVSPPLMI